MTPRCRRWSGGSVSRNEHTRTRYVKLLEQESLLADSGALDAERLQEVDGAAVQALVCRSEALPLQEERARLLREVNNCDKVLPNLVSVCNLSDLLGSNAGRRQLQQAVRSCCRKSGPACWEKCVRQCGDTSQSWQPDNATVYGAHLWRHDLYDVRQSFL